MGREILPTLVAFPTAPTQSPPSVTLGFFKGMTVECFWDHAGTPGGAAKSREVVAENRGNQARKESSKAKKKEVGRAHVLQKTKKSL